jgi:hypothetical protein
VPHDRDRDPDHDPDRDPDHDPDPDPDHDPDHDRDPDPDHDPDPDPDPDPDHDPDPDPDHDPDPESLPALSKPALSTATATLGRMPLPLRARERERPVRHVDDGAAAEGELAVRDGLDLVDGAVLEELVEAPGVGDPTRLLERDLLLPDLDDDAGEIHRHRADEDLVPDLQQRVRQRLACHVLSSWWLLR